MKRVLLYIRVSTSKQDMEGYSIPMQKTRLIAYCKAKGWVVAGIYIDPGFSGASLERPGMTALIKAIEAKKGDVVLVYKLDRLSRSQRDVLYLLEDVFEPKGIAFVSMQESFDTSSVYGKAMLSILSVFGQMERAAIVERTMMGRVGRAERGYFHGGGTDPIGYEYVDGDLVVNKEEARQIRDVYRMYADGYSVTEITRRMEGRTTKHGDWSHTGTVGNVLDNPLYAGIIHFDGVRGKGQHDAIVPAMLNRKVKARRERLRHAEATGDSEYLLTGLIYCADCGARYFANKRPNKKVVYSCHSRAKKAKNMVKDPQCKAPHIPLAELDAMVEAELLRIANDPELMEEIIKKRAAGEGSLETSRSSEVERLDEEINRLMDLLQYDQISSVGEVAERIDKVHAERMALMPKIKADAPRQFDVMGFKNILRDVAFSWDSASARGRRSFLFQVIDGIYINAGGLSIEWSL